MFFPRGALLAVMVLSNLAGAGAQVAVLRYSHMNPSDSIAGRQAAFFARKVDEYSRGTVRIELHPASALGTLTEQLKQTAAGVTAIHHNTAAAFGTIAPDVAVLDTPYVYRDVAHLLKVAAPGSPVMRRLDGELQRSGLKLLYTFYFGTRELTCDRPVLRPEDLAGVKIRSIPFPMYQAAVEGLGAVPVPIDWADTPTALAARAVAGQENPVNTILTSRLYDSQKYLMLTGHIRGAELVVVNDALWRKLPRSAQAQIERAAREASEYGTRLMVEEEQRDLADLRARGMIVIGEREGLELGSFRARTRKIVQERFSARWSEYYRMIEAIK